MPPLFPYQAVVPRPQGHGLGEYAPQSPAPPYNEILDSLLTGYLWGCLLALLFFIIYFAISFCVWAISAALATIDVVIDYLGPRGSCPAAGTDIATTTSPQPEKYQRENVCRVATRSEIDCLTLPLEEPGTDYWDVLSPKERLTLLEKSPTPPALFFTYSRKQSTTCMNGYSFAKLIFACDQRPLTPDPWSTFE